MKSIDLNADLGEGFPNDATLLESVTSTSVCCGAHAGEVRVIMAGHKTGDIYYTKRVSTETFVYATSISTKGRVLTRTCLTSVAPFARSTRAKPLSSVRSPKSIRSTLPQ